MTQIDRIALATGEHRGDPAWPARAAALTWFVLFGFAALFRHAGFGSRGFDLGIFDQALWLIAHGHSAFDTVRGVHILGDHFTPVLWLLAPVYWLPFGTELLLLLQAAALASGIIFIDRLASALEATPFTRTAAILGYALYPGIWYPAIWDFHPVALAAPALIYSVEMVIRRRPAQLAAAGLWILLCKEECALPVAGLALWYALRWRRPLALLPGAACIVWLAISVRLMALFGGVSGTAYSGLYGRLGSGPMAIVETCILHPSLVLRMLAAPEALMYWLLLVAPFAGLILLRPGITAVAAGPILLNALSNRIGMKLPASQYQALVAPFLVVASLSALARLRGRTQAVWGAAWVLAAATLCIYTALQINDASIAPIPPFGGTAAAVRRLLGTIGQDASVSATDSLVPHLTHRTHIMWFPNPFHRWAYGARPEDLIDSVLERSGDPPAIDNRRFQTAMVDYVAINRIDIGDRLSGDTVRQNRAIPAAAILLSPAYGVVGTAGPVLLLQRGADHEAGLRRIGLGPHPTAADAEDYLPAP